MLKEVLIGKAKEFLLLSLILETALHEANDQIIYAGLKDDFDSGRPEKNLNSFYLSLFVNLRT